MKYFVMFLILIGSVGSAFALEGAVPPTTDSNPEQDSEWTTLHFTGKYKNSDRPDQTFIAKYRVTNAELLSIEGSDIEILAVANTTGNGLLELLFPKNFPYTNHEEFGKHAFDIFINGYGAYHYYHPEDSSENVQQKLLNTKTRHGPWPESYSEETECYYLFSIPFYTFAEIKIGYGWNTFIKNPYRGELVTSDCIKQTILSDSFADEPPLKQFKAGISIDEIECRDNHVLIQKHDGSPACVKPETKQKLIERGWAKTSLPETFTLTVSNQSIDKDSVDILVKIDGNVVINSTFETDNQHNYRDYGFLLTNGTHTLYAKSEEGQAELEQTFVIYGKLWGYLSYQYDKENENPRFELIVNDKAFAFYSKIENEN